ncbi:hypothetical protein ASPVEDRAFT_831126 [Aspergillus versicolor CBS 583.65]|uniref:Uncharacterized protein n=1 Tax=Aspergillus versicolor CBS 583.65 TaxID=1036611 RepID=A0A1L9PU33_ASPVE|nr:uncharacterized protein ASPVEDRAFT_831126 [Aspergillus versicolor CBS 583.65]OJJ05049.1 hypothetical protein ASPVEDRAFT_831126 [Aspergillus versicolor CBS 583.65]
MLSQSAANPLTSASAEERRDLAFFLIIPNISPLVSVRSVSESWLILIWSTFLLVSPRPPGLYVPSQIPHQTKMDTSPAAFHLSGSVLEIVIDTTNDWCGGNDPLLSLTVAGSI